MIVSAPRIRVLFYIATLDAGGAERQLLELIRHLDRTHFEPVLGLATRCGPLLAEVPDDVPVHAFQAAATGRRFGLGRLQRWWFLARLLRRERIDVVYDRTFQATLDMGPATWLRPTPRLSAMAADPQVQMELYFPRSVWFWHWLGRRIYLSATRVLTNSAGLRDQAVKYFSLPADHLQVMPNGLNLDRIETLSHAPLATDTSRFRLLTVGRVDQHKGHRDLLEAVRRLVHEQGQTRLLWQIAGDGHERPALEAEAHRLGLEHHVEWLGITANPYPYYRAADLFCLPSLTEGSPNVLLEALCLGTPVLSTDCPSGPAEILERGRWGQLVPPRDPAALAAAVLDRMTRPDAWQSRAAEAAPVIRERYDMRILVRQLEDVIRQCPGVPRDSGAITAAPGSSQMS